MADRPKRIGFSVEDDAEDGDVLDGMARSSAWASMLLGCGAVVFVFAILWLAFVLFVLRVA